jgi:hypothetical protein
MKIILKMKLDKVLIFWPENDCQFIVATSYKKEDKVGKIITSWFHGAYFMELEDALNHFNKQ